MPHAKLLLITGATGPAGRAAALRFAADGALVALNSSSAGRLAALVGELGLTPSAVAEVPGDLRDPVAAGAVVEAVERRFGRIDVLAHLVGGFTSGTPVTQLDSDEVRHMLDQHLWTTLNVIRAAVPRMVARGFGRVMVVSSPFAATPGPRTASYAMGKAVQEVLIRTLAREHAADGITANIVVVRTIDAGHVRETEPARSNAGWTTPEELAETLAWLASPAAAAVNGARIALDGRA